MFFYRFSSTCLAILLFSQSAFAGVRLQSALTVLSVKEEQGQNVQASTTTLLNSSSLGIKFIQGFFLGAQSLYAGNSSTGDSKFAIGPKGGLLLKGFELTGSYLPYASLSRSGDDYTGGGFAVNLGYHWTLLGPLQFGLLVSYWRLNYSERNGAELPVPLSQTYITPLLSLGFDF